MKRIPMIVQALVDDEDFERLSRYSWSNHESGYPVAYDAAARKNVFMHRLVMAAGENVEIDHINRVKWDNRKSNLRAVTRQQNMLNIEAAKKKIRVPKPDLPQSPYKGVHWRRDHQMWGTQFRGKHIGLFLSDLEAAKAYDQAAIASQIPGVWLNFPDGNVTGPEQVAKRQARSRQGATSKYLGVSWNSQNGKWQGAIKRGATKLHLGFYEYEKDCALVYDEVARILGGAGEKTNFPHERCELPEQLKNRLVRRGVIDI